jgi:hypothetical protein
MRQFKKFFAVGAVVVIGTVTIAMSSTAVAAAPYNDNFDSAPLLNWNTAGGAHVFGLTNQTTVDATMQTGEPTGGVGDTDSVWFLWTTSGAWPTQQFKVVTTSGDPTSVTLNVYTGTLPVTDVSGLNPVPVASDNSGDGHPFVDFSSPASAYWIRVATQTGFPVTFNLVWGTSINATAPVWGTPPQISAKIAGSTATVTFAATAATGTVTYNCDFDNAAFPGPPCTSPAVFTGLSKGLHDLQVTATAKLIPADDGAAATSPLFLINIKSGKVK